MATTQEAIARLRMIFETQGADAAVAEMKKLETAETSLGTSSLNLDRAFANLERRYSETARASAEYERAMRTLNAAVAQNPALAERAAAVQQTIAARYQATMQASKQAHEAQTAYGVGMQALAAQAQAASASTGILGSVLGTFGTLGTAAAVGLGAAALAFHKLGEGANNAAQYARQIQHFADATGLTTSQVQGLNKEAARFGINADDMQSALLRFTAGFEEVRSGGGAMLDMLRKIDPALAAQAVSATNEQEALGIVSEALRRATNEFDRARLARVAFGREGIRMLPMMQNLDIDAVTQRYAGRGMSEQMIKDLEHLQGEIDARGTNIANKIYALYVVPWKQAENAVLAYIEATLKIGTSGKLSEQGAGIVGTLSNALVSAFPQLMALKGLLDLVAATSSADTKQMVGDQERLVDAFKKTEEAQKRATAAAANPAGQFKFLMSEKAPGTDERQLEVLKAIMAEYPGLVAQDAVRMARLDDQLRIAAAMPGVMRMQAEEQARINQLLAEGKELSLATAIAGKERAIAQAQINSAADASLAQLRDEHAVVSAVGGLERMRAQAQATYNQLLRQGVSEGRARAIAEQQLANAQAQVNAQAQQQLFNLQNQHAVLAAVTGAEKIRAQEIATINALLFQGVSLENAIAVAAQERANAEAAVNAQIEQQVYKLNQSTELINAQTADMLRQAGAAQKILGINEINVRTQQAFNDAIRQGASEYEAMAVKAATLKNLLAQQRQQETQAAIAQHLQRQEEAGQAEEQDQAALKATNDRITQTITSSSGAALQMIEGFAKAGSTFAQQWLVENQQSGGWLLRDYRGTAEATLKMQQEAALVPIMKQYQQTQEQGQQQLKSLQDQYRLGGAATDQEKAQIQAQITYENLIKQGVQSDLAHQIANQELANAMQDLAKSVDENTTALQAQLDPIYTEGRAALRIGYYGEGTGGTMRTVTGTGFVGTPANMNAPTTPAPSPVVVINNNFPTAAVLGDRTTQYQAANSYGRAIKAMGI